jgi:hypothetical protein
MASEPGKLAGKKEYIRALLKQRGILLRNTLYTYFVRELN